MDASAETCAGAVVVVVVAATGCVRLGRLNRFVRPTGSCPITAGRSSVTSVASRLMRAISGDPQGGPKGRVTRTWALVSPGSMRMEVGTWSHGRTAAEIVAE